MKLTIDETACKKHGVTVPEALFALAIRNSESPMGELLNMENREIIVKNNDVYMITQHWSDVLDEILIDSAKSVEKSDTELLELAMKMREIYPQGRMKDSFGRPTSYYYRCNNSEVVKKLKKFFTVFGNIKDEDILDATKRYVDSFNGNYTRMRLLKYFILKDDVRPGEEGNHVEQISDLATFIENRESGEEGVNTDDSWQVTVRN